MLKTFKRISTLWQRTRLSGRTLLRPGTQDIVLKAGKQEVDLTLLLYLRGARK